MSDKDALHTSIKQLGKALREKQARLKEGIKTVSANRRIAKGQPNHRA
ncbi:hypothetical protein LCGC14_1938170 [marine sediment metagenome]|uniref:Uncharacterized protein n=1 Tax=marine sediment metagenome TaxID=412755 RepID=A0A0F9FLC6_9ZZZZ